MTFSRLATATVLLAGFAMPALAQGTAPSSNTAPGTAVVGHSMAPAAAAQATPSAGATLQGDATRTGTMQAGAMQPGATETRMSPAGVIQPAPVRAPGHAMPATATAGASPAVADQGVGEAARTTPTAGAPATSVARVDRRSHRRVASAVRTQPSHDATAPNAIR